MKGRVCAVAVVCVAVGAVAVGLTAGIAGGVTRTRANTKTARVALGSATVRKVNQVLAEMDRRRVERYDRKLASFGTRHTLSSQDDPHRGVGAARDWITARFKQFAAKAGGRMTVVQQSFITPPGPRVPAPTRVTNVVATLRGTQRASAGRTYVVSGHYDSRCTDPLNAACDAPGADDDASGVSAVLEMARVMSKRKWDATIVFMAVAGEEQGLLGSTYFAEQAKQQNMDIEGMFTNDIVGSSLGQNGVRDRRHVRLFAQSTPNDETAQEADDRRTTGGENDSPPRQLARYAKDAAQSTATGMRVRIVYKRDRYLRGGDHIPFLDRRYPAARFTEVNEDYRHQHQDVRVQDGVQYGDLLRFVDFAYITRVAKVNAATLAGLASAPATPKDVRIHTGQLSNDTDLEWAPNTEPDLAGYEIVYRDTVAPYWTHVIRARKTTTRKHIVGITKDNVLFAVRAVDRSGNRSPAAFPRPMQ
jgi:Peptidase family M28